MPAAVADARRRAGAARRRRAQGRATASRRAKLKILAGILGVPYDELRQREGGAAAAAPGRDRASRLRSASSSWPASRCSPSSRVPKPIEQRQLAEQAHHHRRAHARFRQGHVQTGRSRGSERCVDYRAGDRRPRRGQAQFPELEPRTDGQGRARGDVGRRLWRARPLPKERRARPPHLRRSSTASRPRSPAN